MSITTRSPWFKACAAATAVLTSWFGAGAVVHAQVAEHVRVSSLRVEDAARNLGIDATRIRDAKGQEARDAAEAARRRTAALAKLKQLTALPPERLAQVDALRRSIEDAGRPSLLAGLAGAAEDAGAAARAVRATPGDARAAARLDASQRAVASALQIVGRSEDPKLAEPLGRVRKLEAALRAAKGSGKVDPSKAADVERLAPPARHSERPGRASPHDPPANPPEPRRAIRLGVAPTAAQRELYASLLDAPGLEVETPLGSADPARIVAGIARWAPLLASGGSPIDGLLTLLAAALPPPADADLKGVPEAPLTPEIQALADRLGKDPLAIYNYVHDETDAEPYYGAKKGARGALAELSGNDADLSALLVALLRAAGHPARFEYGTVDLTPEQAMAWSGTTNVLHAGNVLRTGGIPTTVITTDGRPTAVRVEHVWVRAWVPYTNYRGKARADSRSVWIRLDPSVKRATVGTAIDARGHVLFDEAAFLAGPIQRMPLDAFEEQLRAWVKGAGLACKSLDDLIPARRRLPDKLSVLPAELPSRVVSSLATFTGFPSALRHSATIAVGGRTFAHDLASHYGARISLRYRGATAADQAAIQAAGGVIGLPKPYLVHVVPVLAIDGVEQGLGDPLLPGEPHAVDVTVTSPNAGSQVERHGVRAGGVFALGLAVGVVPDSIVAEREAAYQLAVAMGSGGDDLEAARVDLALWRFFWHLHRDVKRVLGLNWFRSIVGVSEGIAGAHVEADLLYGAPVALRRGKYVIDVPRAGWNPYSVDGNGAQLLAASWLAQWQGSAWEHRVWEQAFGTPAISTVRIFQAARSQGVSLLQLDATKAGLVAGLPYSDAAKTDITDALHAGQVATLPEHPITWGDYESREAWALRDPITGSGAFRIGATANGGESNGGSGGGGGSGCQCGTCGCALGKGHSSVNLALGNLFFSETDLSVPARGIPVSFSRRYDSMSPHGGRLGPGWQHSWELRLLFQPDGSVDFLNEQFRTQRFAKGADGSYTAEPGYHEKLAPISDGWVVTYKDGTEYRFRSDGQLRAIQTLNDHVVQLLYDASNRLEAVYDATMRRALSFEYEATGLLASVKAFDGRTVAFEHAGGDLVAVTDVLGEREEYGYDGAHRLNWKKDRNGNVVFEFYDGDGRWIGGQDPDGYGRHVVYDALNRRALHFDKRGAQTVYEYNERGNPVAVTDPVGNLRAMEWNDRNEKLAAVDARGNRSETTYDVDGNVLAQKDGLDPSWWTPAEWGLR